MNITTKTRTVDELADYDYRDKLEIFVDGKVVFKVSDGEPEDSNLSRDFSDCYNIPDLMQMAYEAGKNGEDLIIDGEVY